MAFDASRQSEPDREPAFAFEDEPIDYVDWGMRIVVFSALLAHYLYWVWTVIVTAVHAFG